MGQVHHGLIDSFTLGEMWVLKVPEGSPRGGMGAVVQMLGEAHSSEIGCHSIG
jgi:hypothetical protein